VVADCLQAETACTDPDWLPQGNALTVFQALEFRPNPGLYTVDLACRDEPPTCPVEPVFFLAGTPPFDWSPAGDKLAFITFTGDLGIADSRGRMSAQLSTPLRGRIESLAWSPDGAQLAITLDTYGDGHDAYLVAPDEGEWKRLLLPEGSGRVLMWFEVP